MILVFVCLALGLMFQRSRQFHATSSQVLNAYVIHIALPALILIEIAKLSLDRSALLPVVMAWVVMLFSASMTILAARLLHWTRNVTGAMVLVVTLGNTSFVGFPLIEAHLGPEAIGYAILYDQFGTFLAFNTVGLAIAGYYAREHETAGQSLWLNILKFPPFVALWLAFLLRLTGCPDWLHDILSRLAATLVPVVMVAVGLQWKLRLAREDLQPLLIALLLILVVTPTFAWCVIRLLGVQGLVARVIVMEAAMPAMISAGVLASAHHLAPRLASMVVGYSLLLSLLTVWIWRLLLGA